VIGKNEHDKFVVVESAGQGTRAGFEEHVAVVRAQRVVQFVEGASHGILCDVAYHVGVMELKVAGQISAAEGVRACLARFERTLCRMEV